MRLPAVFLALGTTLLAYRLTKRPFLSDRPALRAVLVLSPLPLYAAGSILMTFDAPLMLLVPLVVVIVMIPVSLGGLGIRERAPVYHFGKVGMESAGALAMSLSWFLLVILASLPGGLLFALQGHQEKAAGQRGG